MTKNKRFTSRSEDSTNLGDEAPQSHRDQKGLSFPSPESGTSSSQNSLSLSLSLSKLLGVVRFCVGFWTRNNQTMLEDRVMQVLSSKLHALFCCAPQVFAERL